MENPIKMDDLGVPLFLETPYWETFQKSVSLFRLFALIGGIGEEYNPARTARTISGIYKWYFFLLIG